jgi:hypothetical protein
MGALHHVDMPIDRNDIISICEEMNVPEETIFEIITYIDSHKNDDPKSVDAISQTQGITLEEQIAAETDWKKKTALIAMKISRDIQI